MKVTKNKLAMALAVLLGVLGWLDTGTVAAAERGVVNINTASAAELQLLPGVGPSRAQAIIAQRSQGKFKSVQELLQVKGIGKALLHKLEPLVVCEGPTTMKAPTAKRGRKRTKAKN